MVLLGNDHLHAFSMDRYPALAIGAGPRFGPVETELFLPSDIYEGAEGLASHLTRGLLASGFDPLLCRELALDHSFVSPLALMGDTGLPIVPILQNTVAPPLPPAARSYELGVSLRRLLEDYAGCERVAVVATGAPSHWIGTPEQGDIDEAWDREVIDMLCRADAKGLAAWPQAKIDAGGNGGQRDQDLDFRRGSQRRHRGESVDLPDRAPVVSGGDGYRVARRPGPLEETLGGM